MRDVLKLTGLMRVVIGLVGRIPMRLKTVGLIATFTIGLLSGPLSLLSDTKQPPEMRRIGYLTPRAKISSSEKAFRQALRELGYIEGQNILIERRTAKEQLDHLPELAVELARKRVDIIVVTSVQGALAAKKATQSIPIVFAVAQDPVGIGLVASLAQPGGNVTGATDFARELAGKRLQLLKETVPHLSRLAILLWKPAGPDYPAERKEIETVARASGLQLQLMEVRKPDDLENAFSAMSSTSTHAFLGLTDTRFYRSRKQIIGLSVKHRLPAVYQSASFMRAGALMSYGPNRIQWRRRLAVYVDKILKGAKPAELPVEQPKNFELIINLKTAKRIGLPIPPSVLYRADKVIR